MPQMSLSELMEMKAQIQASDREPASNPQKVSQARKEREYTRGKKGQANGGQFASSSTGGPASKGSKAKAKIKVKKTPTGPLTVAEDSKYRRMIAAQGGYLDVSEASEITPSEIKRLRAAGWTSKAGDGREALYPPPKNKPAKKMSATEERTYRALAEAGPGGGWDIPENTDPDIVKRLQASGWTSKPGDKREALYPPPLPIKPIPPMTPIQERTYLDLAKRNDDGGLRVGDPDTANLLARAGWTTHPNLDGRPAMFPPGKEPKEKKSAANDIDVAALYDFLVGIED